MFVLSFHGKHLIDKNLKLLKLNHGALISEKKGSLHVKCAYILSTKVILNAL